MALLNKPRSIQADEGVRDAAEAALAAVGGAGVGAGTTGEAEDVDAGNVGDVRGSETGDNWTPTGGRGDVSHTAAFPPTRLLPFQHHANTSSHAHAPEEGFLRGCSSSVCSRSSFHTHHLCSLASLILFRFLAHHIPPTKGDDGDEEIEDHRQLPRALGPNSIPLGNHSLLRRTDEGESFIRKPSVLVWNRLKKVRRAPPGCPSYSMPLGTSNSTSTGSGSGALGPIRRLFRRLSVSLLGPSTGAP